MKKLFAILIALFAVAGVKANDGAFYAQGNQLMPITETTIKVQKEILTITRVTDTINKWGSMFQVNVYYEFFNPGPAKDLIVGFESPTPDGHAFEGNLAGVYPKHPYMYDFKVMMNNKALPYQIAHVPYKYKGDYEFDYSRRTQDYYKNGQIQDMNQSQFSAYMAKYFESEEEYIDFIGYPFYYVYHFNAHFNEGKNVIRHTYTVKGSAMVMEKYVFRYILTAANRWANNGIDDFTLEINMGDRQSFSVAPDFYNKANEWTFSGKGRVGQRKFMVGMCENCPLFHVQSGSIVYRKKNFHPEGELYINSDNIDLNFFDFQVAEREESENFVDGLKTQYYDLYAPDRQSIDISSIPADLKRIMKNTPFAYRGYVFKDKGLQRYFDSTDWYIPNPEYKADMTTMSKSEKEWIQFWSK